MADREPGRRFGVDAIRAKPNAQNDSRDKPATLLDMANHMPAMSNRSDLPGLSQSLEGIAIAHFMSSYVPGSHFDYLPWMYGQVGTGSVLLTTVHAASMASLAHELGDPSVMKMARRSYTKALLETNCALSDPCTATSDATLISVLLLSLFEAITWARAPIPQSWTTHTRGALALSKLRGAQQFESPVLRKLFVQVGNIICVDSLQQKQRLSQELMDLISIAMTYESECPRYRLACLTGNVSNLIADIEMGGMTAEEVVVATQLIDADYISFGQSLPDTWQYEEVILPKSRPDVYGKSIHRYPSHRAAQFWNSVRMTRILLNEVIHAHAFYLPFPHSSEVQRPAVHNIQRTVADICASIPQFTNPSEFNIPIDPHFPCAQHLSSVSSPEFISPRASTASLLWPLSAVRGACLASEGVRAYAAQRLKRLGAEFRVPQVEKVALESSDVNALQDGLHMFYVS